MPSKSKLDIALAVAARHLRVFPLEPGTKYPSIDNWPEKATTDPAVIRRWWTCPVTGWPVNRDVAVATGQGLLAVDIDVKNGKPGADTWAMLDLEHGDTPTLTLRTKSGGRHRLYATTRAIGNGANSLGEGVDHRGERGFIKWYDDVETDLPIAAAPAWLTERLSEAPESRPAGDAVVQPGADLNSAANLTRAIDYLLNQAPEAIEGHAGDDTTYRVAAALKDFGISETKALDLLLDHWNENQIPPWPQDDLQRKVANAYAYGQNPIGIYDPAADFQPPPGTADTATDFHPGDTPPQDKTNPGPLTAHEVNKGAFPRAEHIWDFGVIVKGHPNLFTGDGGVGKSTLDIQLGLAVATGQPLFGHDTLQMPVLLILCEDDYGETKHRLQAAAAHLGIDLRDAPLHLWCRPNEENTLAIIDDIGNWTKGPFFGPLARKLRAIGPCLCFLDPASDLFIMDENKRLPVNAMSKAVLGSLTRATGATFVVNHHPSKKSMEDGSFFSGSTAWRAAFRSMISMEKPDKDGPKRTLRIAKSQYRKDASLLLWAEDGFFSLVPSATGRDAAEKVRDAILTTIRGLRERGITVVKAHGNGHKPADIAEAIQVSHGIALSVKDVVSHLGFLERAGYVRWAPCTKGKGGAPATYDVDLPGNAFASPSDGEPFSPSEGESGDDAT